MTLLRPLRPPSTLLKPAALIVAAAMATSGCTGGSATPGAGELVVGGTPGLPGTGEAVAAPPAGTDAAPAPGTLMTAAPIQATTPPPGTPLPTAEAAAAATQRQAEAMAALQPRFVDSIGLPGTEPGQLTLPFDVAVAPGGDIYISDSTGVQQFGDDSAFIRRIDPEHVPLADGIAVGPDGRLYVTGSGAEVRVYAADGRPAGTIGTAGDQPGQLRKPTDAALDGAGNLYVVDAGNARVEKYSPAGGHVATIGERGEGSGQFTAPRRIAVDAQDRIYVGAGDDFLVQRFTSDGRYLDTFGQGTLDATLYRTGGVAVDDQGVAYISQAMLHAVQAFDVRDKPAFLWQMGGEAGQRQGQFNSPGGMAIAGGRLYVADTGNHRVQVFELAPAAAAR